MSLLTLRSGPPGWLASDRLVYTAEETGALLSAEENAYLLGVQHASELEREKAAIAEAVSQGLQEGREQGRREMAEELSSALASLTRTQEEHVRTQRENVVSTALEVVRRIAPAIASAEWIAALASEAAEGLVDAPRRVLRVHPSQINAVSDQLHEHRVTVFDAVQADDALGTDEAEIDTGPGSVRIDLRTQLEEIARGLCGTANEFGA